MIALIKCSEPSRDNPIVSPPMGIMYLASVLRNEGHKVIIVDHRLKPYNLKYIINKLFSFQPDVVGLSAVTVEAHNMHKIASIIKETFKDCVVIAGGPHPTVYPEDVLNDNNIDFAVLGEGEITTKNLINAIEKNEDYRSISGIAYKDGNKIVFTNPTPFIQDLDSIPFPAWDLIDIDEYPKYYRFVGAVGRRERYMPVFTSRGCPYRCIYCHRIFGKRFRERSVDNVIDELDILANKYNIHDIEIIDDVFNLKIKRAESILNKIIGRKFNLRIAFINGLRSDILTYDLLKLMKKAGTYQISIAVETASPRLQKFIKKNLNLAKVKQSAIWAKELDIFTHGLFMLGFPTETKEELEMTIDYAVNTPFDIAQFVIVNPFKGTELYYMCEEKLKGFVFKDYDYEIGRFNLSAVEDKVLFGLQKEAYRRFYFKRDRFFNLLFHFPNKRNLLIGMWILLKRAFRRR